MIIRNSCYKCENRKVGCHANCEIYKKYREALDVINNRRRIINSYEYNPRRCRCGKVR